MSAEHVGWAFRQPLPPTRKLVLVALADRCNKDTLRCDPSIRKLSADTGLNERSVSRALVDLEADGLIQKIPRQRENGSATSNEYKFPDVTVPPPPRHSVTPPPGSLSPPEPEVRTRKEPTSLASPPKQRPRNPIWDALTHVFGEPSTSSSIKIRGKVCRDLIAAGATPDQVIARASTWPAHFDTATMTDLALEKHWDTLGRRPLRRQR